MKSKISISINIFLLTSIVIGFLLFPIGVKAALVLSGVTPSVISNDQINTITISGTDLIVGAVVSLDGFGPLTTSYSTSLTLMATVPAGIPIGAYSVTVTNPDLSTTSLANALTVILDSPTATPSQTVEPPNNYERPVVVVDTYSLDQDTISPGNSFILFITLYNAGQQYATNVVATFSSGDLMPRETGGVVAVGEIAPSNHREFSQPLYLNTNVWGSVASINMVLTYTNETGTSYSETFTITLPVYQVYSAAVTATPTPTQSPTPSNKPQLVITGYTTDIAPLQPGTQFNLTIITQNMGNSTAKNVTMIVGGGSSMSGGDAGTQQPGGISGAGGEFTNFAPIGASNVQSIGDFSPGSNVTAYQPLIVNVNTTPGAYPLKISFVYIDDHNHEFVDNQVITLLVYRVPILEINFYQDVSTLYTGQPNTLPLQVVNLGRNSVVLGNMHVNGSNGQFSNNVILVGTLDPGGYFTLDATYIPDLPGSTDLIVTIDYTNDFNQSEVIIETLTVEVMEQTIIEPPNNGSQNGSTNIIPQAPETFLHKVWRFILGLIGLDSGIISQSLNNNQPIETVSPEQPIIVPIQPPLKGP